MHKHRFWWYSQLAWYLFKPKPHILQSAVSFAQSRHWTSEKTVISFHVRSADRSINKAMPFFRYASSAIEQNWYQNVWGIFLATDDFSNIRSVENNVINTPFGCKDFPKHILYDPTEDRRGEVVKDIDRCISAICFFSYL